MLLWQSNILDRPIHSYGGNRPGETLERLLEVLIIGYTIYYIVYII